VVDHHALIWLVTRTAKTNCGRVLHWISDLQEYYFEIVHRSGTAHIDVDAVSVLLNYSDVPKRVEDSSSLVPPAHGIVTNQDLLDLYKVRTRQRD